MQDNINATDNVLGWKRFFLRLGIAATVYCTVSHIVIPNPPLENVITAAGKVLSVVVSYLVMFIPLYVVVAAITFVLVKNFNKNRLHSTNILAMAIVPSLIVGGIGIFFIWYGTAHAAELNNIFNM
ncbi:MAG: hypothetical protein PHN84_07910 [Desulfuromonadaceae bacterium]|nr:hypothetical protein [Desulfuromonadaceae bacterium]MDD2854757.1 hypothetical protein [Desulfuromonadaceae bacterium]